MPLYYPARHARHIARALAVAGSSTERQKHAALITKGNRVLAVGVNAARNAPQVCSDPETQAGVHAEMAAIRSLPPDTDFGRLTLYSVRQMRSGLPGLAKPCDHCQAELDRLGFKDVIWT